MQLDCRSRVSWFRISLAACGALWLGAAPLARSAEAEAGLAMRSEPKYRPGFKAFDYVNPDAPKGGTLTIGLEGTADTQNPFAVKGDPSYEISELVFQELAEPSMDEPFSRYPGLVDRLDVAPDKLSLTVHIRPTAKFSDGAPVTAEDILFSWNTFQSAKVAPFYKSYWADVKEVKAVDAHTVKFTYAKVNPELPLITTELHVLPKHIYETGDFATLAVGTGPYQLKDFKPGEALTLTRVPDWWGKDLAVYRGRFNFDTIVIKYYKDPTALTEAFKKGDFDVLDVRSAKMWAKDLTGDKFDRHYIRKELIADHNAQGGQGFLFNLRNPLFQDVRVRQALALAFDFDWSNKNLFYGQYQQAESFFQNTPLAATGMPTPEELAVLTPLKADLQPEVFTKPMGWLGKGVEIKDRLRQAVQLLKAAGYTTKNGAMEGPGGRLEFKYLTEPGGMQRVLEPYTQNLRKLGVLVSIEEKEQSVFVKRVDNREFAMANGIFGESLSPGNEQRDYWSSASADEKFSQNYTGLKNKAVDALVNKIIYASTRAELELMTRCLDRALYHEHIMVPNWFSPANRLAFWDRYSHWATLPSYYSTRAFLSFLWLDKAKAQTLSDAQTKGVALP